MTTSDCLLRAERVTKHTVSLELDRTSVLALGSSSLARILVGLERPSTGVVTFNGHDLARLVQTRVGRLSFRRAVQLVEPTSFDRRRPLRDALRLPLRVLSRTTGDMADRRIDATLRELGLDPELAERLPAELSDGQLRRFTLARALVSEPGILVCDRLDPSVLASLMRYSQKHGIGLAYTSGSVSLERPAA
jgi:peptide/nickel transport system ATP-binding protein